MSSKELTIKVEKRVGVGSSDARRMRHAGMVPAVVYSHGQPGISLLVDELAVKSIQYHSGMVSLDVKDTDEILTVIVKDVQYNAISGKVIHLDLQGVRLDEVVTSVVSLEASGEPVGAVGGGVLEQSLHEIEIECQVAVLPEVLMVDVTALELDAMMHVSDLVLPEGVTVLSDPGQVVFTLHRPKVEEAEEEEVAAEAPVAADGCDGRSGRREAGQIGGE
jgi:large subunit ribosomal protein L25